MTVLLPVKLQRKLNCTKYRFFLKNEYFMHLFLEEKQMDAENHARNSFSVVEPIFREHVSGRRIIDSVTVVRSKEKGLY